MAGDIRNVVLVGHGGAGKTSLVKALTGGVPVVRGTIYSPLELNRASRAGYVSFEQHQRLVERDRVGSFVSPGAPDTRRSSSTWIILAPNLPLSWLPLFRHPVP